MITGLGPISGDAAASKIVELAKKVREITASLESEKTKNKQLAKSLKDMETQMSVLKKKQSENDYLDEDEENEIDFNSDGEPNISEKKVNLKKENKDLKEKLNQATHKMMEFKSQTECLKLDLKKAHKVRNKLTVFKS
jgi:chromosome segregation ATPase